MTRKTFVGGTRFNGSAWVRIICDECKQTIGEELEGHNEVLSKKYRDQNFGHECTRCRKNRENAYDMWVLNCPMGGE